MDTVRCLSWTRTILEPDDRQKNLLHVTGGPGARKCPAARARRARAEVVDRVAEYEVECQRGYIGYSIDI